jgi:plastocyanin
VRWIVSTGVVLTLALWALADTARGAEDPHAGHDMADMADMSDMSDMSGAEHAGHDMTFDATGMVMNANASELPRGCTAMGPEHEFTVYAGVEFGAEYPGKIFGMSQHEYEVEPCARVTVTFVNNDAVRHQWMVHGLPRYLYPQGMFHLEAAGGEQQSGTFIVPSDDRTYMVHCDMAQHMEKGMKGQLIVGAGSGDLWAVPGVSAEFYADSYLPAGSLRWVVVALLAGVGVGVGLAGLLRFLRHHA